MAENIETTIQKKWQEEQLLGLNCILFRTGKVIILQTTLLYSPQRQYEIERMSINPLCETSLQSILHYNQEPWTFVTPMAQKIELTEGHFIVYGEGGMGNEGFITRLNEIGELEWSVFLTKSNPFVKANLNGKDLIVYNNNDDVFTISLKHPEKILVQINKN